MPTSTDLPPPVTAPRLTRLQACTRSVLEHPLLNRRYRRHALLTLSGTGMGATAIAFMIMAKKSADSNPWHSPGFIVLFVVWVLATLTFLLCNCARARRRPVAGIQLPPAAHYMLRTLTGVLCMTVLLLERLRSAGEVDELWMFLPLVVSLSACLCSVFGDAGDFLGPENGEAPDEGQEMQPGAGDRARGVAEGVVGLFAGLGT